MFLSTQGGGVKKWQNSVHVVVECPLSTEFKLQAASSLTTKNLANSHKQCVQFQENIFHGQNLIYRSISAFAKINTKF